MKSSLTLPVLLIFALATCSLLGGGDNNPDIPGKIVFSAKDEAGISQIYTMKANGTDVKQLTHAKNGFESQPSWSPDGQRIIYSSASMSHSTSQALVIMNADGSHKHLLDKRVLEPEGITLSLYGSNARWSPDGTKVAYDACPNCELRPNNDIYVFDLTNDTGRKLTQSRASDQHPTWSPGDKKIAFTSDRAYINADTLQFRHDLYVVNTDGSNLKGHIPRKLINFPAKFAGKFTR